MEKKTYQKPKTKVFELKVQQQLLNGSGNLENYGNGGHIDA